MPIRFILIALCLLPVLIACEGKKQEPVDRTPSRVKAETLKLEKTNVPVYRIFMGKTQAKDNVIIGAKTSGYITNIYIEEGKAVKKNQRLISIDSEGIKARISSFDAEKDAVLNQKKALEAELKYAESQFKRFKALKESNAATEEEFEKVKSSYFNIKENFNAMDSKVKSIEGSLKEASNQLQYVDITSPVNGVITKKYVDNGSFVQMGMPLLEIDGREEGFWFETSIDERLFDLVNNQKQVFLSIPSLSYEQTTSFSLIIPDIDPRTRTFSVKIDLDSDNMRSGHFGRIYLQDGEKKTFLIPATSLVMRGGLTGVFVLGKDRIVHWRIIKTGQLWKKTTSDLKIVPVDNDINNISDKKETFIEAINGLDANDTIITSGLEGIREGFRVE
jgi:RND family efflux transporter MFP subunit